MSPSEAGITVPDLQRSTLRRRGFHFLGQGHMELVYVQTRIWMPNWALTYLPCKKSTGVFLPDPVSQLCLDNRVATHRPPGRFWCVLPTGPQWDNVELRSTAETLSWNSEGAQIVRGGGASLVRGESVLGFPCVLGHLGSFNVYWCLGSSLEILIQLV